MSFKKLTSVAKRWLHLLFRGYGGRGCSTDEHMTNGHGGKERLDTARCHFVEGHGIYIY